MSALAPEQRGRLVGAKLAALVAAHSGERPDPVTFPGGAAAVVGTGAWVLLDADPEASRGVALAWAQRHAATRLDVVADTGTGVLARQAGAFALPIAVWSTDGTRLVPTTADPPPPVIEPAVAELAAAAVLVDAGATVVVEHGVVRGEVLGLEVARVVTVDGDVVVQPGVGRNDREGHAMVAGTAAADTDVVGATLERVVAEVRRHRTGPTPDSHPLGRMARGRWLGHLLTVRPELVGAARLERVEPTVARHTVADGAAFAAGELADGTPVVVGCAGGIDLGLVPEAADVRLAVGNRVGAEPQLVFAAAGRDLHPVVRRMADALVQPAEVVALPDDWHLRTPTS
jgi:hypothetical protein